MPKFQYFLPPYSLTEPDIFAFVLIPLVLVALFGWGVYYSARQAGDTAPHSRRTALLAVAAAAGWMALTWTLANRGVLLAQGPPPPFGIMLAGVLVLAPIVALGRIGARIARFVPLWALVAVQSFRLPLEIAMHRLVERGIMPPQMSYSGRNWDIVTGASALCVALLLWAGLGGRKLVWVWNAAGLALLVNIVAIAVLSVPTFQYFGPLRVNVFVMLTPFVWLPAVMVLTALAGHLVIFRSLAPQANLEL
jgi:hypothetical protein